MFSMLRWRLPSLIFPVLVALVLVGQEFLLQAPRDLIFAWQNNLPLSSAFGLKTTHCYQSVRTLDDKLPLAQCFRVQGGRFSDVYTPEESFSLFASARSAKNISDHSNLPSEVIFHDQGHVLPGLWDGHGHLLQYGEFLHGVNLFGVRSTSEIRDRIAAYVARRPDVGGRKNWIRGVGWDQNEFENGRMPTAKDLEQDPALRGLYIMVDRVDVHCTLVSQPILDLLNGNLPDVVEGGEIIRDPGIGVFCDNAMDLVYDLWPRPGRAEKKEFTKTAMKELNRVGIVGMHDAGVTAENLAIYKELAGTETWTVRVYAMVECMLGHNHFCPDEVATTTFGENQDMLAIQSVKLFADGALGSWGSAMLAPYNDKPSTSGSLLINASALSSLVESWAEAGYQVNIHAIGDLANRLAIDSLESALRRICPFATDDSVKEALRMCQSQRKFRIEHAQIIHPDDQARMQDLGIIPSIQPTHATSDMRYALSRLGEERLGVEAYRMKSLLPLNPVLGSDFPVEPPDPFQGMYAAVARRSPHTGRNVEGGLDSWHGDEALSLSEALIGFTQGPAFGTIASLKTGMITREAAADWVVLDQSLDEYSIEDLRNMKVRETWVGGKMVYKRDQED